MCVCASIYIQNVLCAACPDTGVASGGSSSGNSSRYASIEAFEQAAEGVFKAHQSVSYIAVVDDNVARLAQKGSVSLHPTNLQKFHVQAALLVRLSGISAELFGALDYVSASFDSRFAVMVAPLSSRLHVVVVTLHASKYELDAIWRDVADLLLKPLRLHP